MSKNKIEFHTEQRAVSDLVPYAKNPRKLSDKSAKDLKASLSKFGLVEIPVINTDNTIIAGHQRLKIMALLGKGDEIIDVRVPDHFLEEKDLQEYNIRSNKNSGEWDFDVLANEFEQDDLLDWGFEPFDLGIGAVDPNAPVLPEGQKGEFSQMTITLHNDQFEEINKIIAHAKNEGLDTHDKNQNSNGNAIYNVLCLWETQNK